MLAEVDNLAKAGPLLGPNGGDQVLSRAAMLLRIQCRPTDLVSRNGGAEFAVWISGADQPMTRGRARRGPVPAGTLPGRWTRQCHAVRGQLLDRDRHAPDGESFSDLAGRAAVAMQQVKCEGGGYWRVSLGSAA